MLSFWREHLSFADLVLIALIVVLSIILMQTQWKDQRSLSVHVYKDGKLIGQYPLNKNRKIEIDEHNTVEIVNGKALMQYADCPDKRCMKQGATSLMPIVCLPNRVVLEIKNPSSKRRAFYIQ